MSDLILSSERRLTAAEFQLSTEQHSMEAFEPIRDFFQRRQAKHLSERASMVQIVTERGFVRTAPPRRPRKKPAPGN